MIYKYSLIILFTLFSQCVFYSATARQMENTSFGFVNPIGENVCIGNVKGRNSEREDQSQMYFIYVGDDELRRSISDSISNARGFEKFDGNNCDWTIDVIIRDLVRLGGFVVSDSEVKTKIRYVFLYKGRIQKILDIESKAEVRYYYARFGTERTGMAMELSVKNNIREFLIEMSRLYFNSDGRLTEIRKEKITE